jgi:ferredoxin-type protein NapH
MTADKGFRRWAHKARLASQLLFFALFVVVISGAICVFAGPSVSALEPMGFLQVLFAEARQNISTLGLTAVAGTIAFVAAFVVFGGAFCGWVCPVGTVCDITGRMKKTQTRKGRFAESEGLPEVQDQTKSYFEKVPVRETIALSVVGASFVSGSPVWCPICPIGGVCRSVGLNGFIGGLEVAAFVAVPAVAEAKSPRWFCKWVCPVGGLITRMRMYVAPAFKLKVNRDACTECGECREVCPYDLEPFKEEDLAPCIMCLKCYQVCPYSGKGIQIAVRSW